MLLDEADLRMTEMAYTAEGQRIDDGDKYLYVKFYLQPKRDAKASLESGRPIFKDEVCISIIQPGNKENIIDRVATPKDLARFPKHFTAFKERGEVAQEGTPLESWTALTKSQVEELKHFNIYTMEQLAGITDAHSQNFLGIQDLKRRALAYLEASGVSAAGESLAAELDKRDSEIATLHAQVGDLTMQLADMQGIIKKLGKD